MTTTSSEDWFCAARTNDVKTLQLLLDQHVDVNMKETSSERTALACATMYDHVDCVKCLLQAKADLELREGEFGSTALMTAVDCGAVQVMQVLLDAGADVNRIDNCGWTAIMNAVFYDNQQAVKVLLESGADLGIKSTRHVACILPGSTAMDILRIYDAPPSSHRRAVAQLMNNAKDLVWSMETHCHFTLAFKSCVTILLMLHRTTCIESRRRQKKLRVSHRDSNNRFWKLPRALLFRILAFSAPLQRLIVDDTRATENTSS